MHDRAGRTIRLALFGCAALALVGCAGRPGALPEASPAHLEGAWAPPPLSPLARLVASSVHVALGLPKDDDDGDDHVMDKGVYVVSYNADRHVPNWVSWRLTAKDLGSAGRTNAFYADDALPSGFYQVTPQDYAGSGYDRGHLCPSGDRTRSARDNAVTFLMTNVLPQTPALNRGPWRELEEHLRTKVRREGVSAWVVAGGVFSGRDPTLEHGIAVPTHTFKVVVTVPEQDGIEAVTARTTPIAVMMPNEDDLDGRDWESYAVSVDDVEAATGYDFLNALSTKVQDSIEARVAVR